MIYDRKFSFSSRPDENVQSVPSYLVPENWNLQRILFKANLDPEAPVQEGAITTLIYGVKSTACQSETGLDDIAEHVKTEKLNGFYE